MISRIFSLTIVLFFSMSGVNAQIEYEKYSSIGVVNWSYIDKEDIKPSVKLYTFEIFNLKKMVLVSLGSDVKKFEITDDIDTGSMRIIYCKDKAALILDKDDENQLFRFEFFGSNLWLKGNAQITYFY
jgi:hypothetical protein